MALTSRPRGTNDIIPGEIELWLDLEEKIRAVCHAYGYTEIRTPIFEHTELFQRGIGDATDIVEKEMYTFLDRGERSITLRPEGTAPLVRAYIENNLGSGALPVKLFYYGPMFRYERPQAGRYRQFVQFGCEALGSADPLLDVEAIALPLEIYRSCGLSGFEVQLNSIGCPSCRGSYREKLIEYFTPHSEELCKSCQNRLHRNPLRLLDCKVKGCQVIIGQAPVITEYLCTDCKEHFSAVRTYLEELEIAYELNPRLVRGFDYYTRTVFEVTSSELGSQNAIGAGGRYDGLVEEVGGKPTPAVGYAVGVDRLLLALKGQDKLKVRTVGPNAYLVHFGGATKVKAAQVAHFLRGQGLWAELDHMDRSVKAQMKAANRLESRYVVVFGEEELARNLVVVRNMLDGQEQEVTLDDLQQLTKLVGACAK
ncbi:MAG TPA: histidine--tRNA ligase [Firmicutes bacterium]|nr:histidine--tRNA ligase [Bacillota bacterium]